MIILDRLPVSLVDDMWTIRASSEMVEMQYFNESNDSERRTRTQ